MTDHPALEIAFASDANYFDGLAVALASVLRHTTGLSGARIHVLDGGLADSQRRALSRLVAQRREPIELVFHTLGLEEFSGARPLAGSLLTYARLLLPALLGQASHVLYLDVDVYFGMDLQLLWRHPMQGAGVAAVRDVHLRTLGHDGPFLEPGSPEAQRPYFNAGILKIDLDYWRRHRVGETAMSMARDMPGMCRCHDQTLLNHLLRDAVAWLPEAMNRQLREGNAIDDGSEPCTGRNLHFTTHPKPWQRHSLRAGFRRWRAGYAAGVSRWPAYMLDYEYWAKFVWYELLQESPAFVPACRLLLASRVYRLVPGLNLASLERYVAESAPTSMLEVA